MNSTLLLARRRGLAFTAETPPTPPGPVQTITYTSDNTTDFLNPERGWYAEDGGGLTVDVQNALPVRSLSQYPRLQMRYVRLDAYRNTDTIPSGFIDDLADEMASWRTTGKKAVLRFGYNRDSSGADAPWPRMKGHIEQLSPLLHEYKDVIGVYQGGFVGAWAEQHQSSNNIHLDAGLRKAFVETVLDEAPSDMMVQFRYPFWLMGAFSGTTPLSYSDRFTTSRMARAGHFNDCYGSGQWMVTYWNDGGFTQQQQRNYANAIGPLTVMGGETCNANGLDQWNDGPYIIQQMELMGMDYLNSEYWTGMTQKWQDTGYLATISRRLGYRLHLSEARLPVTVTAGQTFQVSMDIHNSGFGKVYNPRPIDIVLVPSSGPAVTVRMTSDARRLLPLGGNSSTLELEATLPGGTASGTYAAYLALPDPSPHLSNDPRYSIRLANAGGIWNGSTGMHDLGAVITVSGA